MANMKYYAIPSSKLNEVDYEFGNLIFCEDLHRIYLDGVYGRVCYDSIYVFSTELERYEFEHPFEGFYFVEETKTLWRYYEEEWTAITEPSIENVKFIPFSELPIEGEYAVLYICEDTEEQYIWKDNEYVKLNSSAETIWHEV